MNSGAHPGVSPTELKAMLGDGRELALVDVREQGVYFHGHLLFASCIPLSHLEMRVADLIPRRGTRIVLCDSGSENLAQRAADKLVGFGYTHICVLEGGVDGWRNAGYEVFSGVNVVSKAFGEYVEHRYDTPRLEPEELSSRVANGEDLVILDSRPLEEYRNLSIPGGVDCPGAELVYRIFDIAPDPQTLVVVNCAGRTRSIIGAQSLINAGIPNRVMALKNGTMGWELAGFQVAKGKTTHAPDPSPTGKERAQRAAAAVAERFGVRQIDRTQLHQWEQECDVRTLYVLDVRTPGEFALGHLPGSRHAPGGQLVQATDEYAVTRHGRIVLVDNDGVRATMTASWLIQMGWNDVYVLKDGLVPSQHKGTRPPTLSGFKQASTITIGELHTLVGGDGAPLILDFGTSLQYRRQHIPGAWWGVRSRISQVLDRVPASPDICVTSPDGILAHYVAQEILALRPGVVVRVVEGGTNAWLQAGLPTQSGIERACCEPNDIWYKPYEQAGGIRQAMEDYLTWEVNLVEQIARDGDAKFG